MRLITPASTVRRYWPLAVCLVLLALFAAPLLTHIYLGSYSRFLADDFCSAAVARSKGVIAATLYWYTNWTGRFSANFLDSLFGYFGPKATPYATALVITIWFAVLTLALFHTLRGSQPEHRIRLAIACVGAGMMLFVLLDVAPMVVQSLYWGQGMRSVVPPLILGTAYIALIGRGPSLTTSLRTINTWPIIAGLLTFVAGGFSETYFALQTSAIVVALLVTIARKQIAPAKVFSFLVAGLLGSISAGVVDFFAPGNQFRRNAFPPPPGPIELSHIVSIGLRDFFQILLPSTTSRIDLLGLTLCAFIVGTGVFRGGKLDAGASRQFWPLIWLPLAGLALLLSCVVPMAYATSLPLAYRTLIIPTYVLVCILSVWGYRLGQLFSGAYQWLVQQAPWSKVVPVAILFAFALWAFDSSRKMLKLQPAMLGYSRAWDERERMIENSKSQRIPYAIVRRLPNLAALDEIEPDPKIVWLTKCVQDYYGIPVMPDLGNLIGEPNAEAKQAEVENEFRTIQPVPGSVPTELNSIYKTTRGKIGFYKTDQSPEQIRSHYQAELSRHGWKYIGTKQVEAFQRFSGGTQTLFCKGDTSAILFVTGQDQERLGYTYSVALNWGSSSGFVWGAIDCKE